MTSTPERNAMLLTAQSAASAADSYVTAGAVPLKLDVTRIHDVDSLEAELGRTFEIPYPFKSLAAVISLGVDIDEWHPSPNGYVLVVEDIDRLPEELAAKLVSILPDMADRFRSGDELFVAAISSMAHRSRLLEVLREENDGLDRFGKRPGSAPTWAVPIIELD